MNRVKEAEEEADRSRFMDRHAGQAPVTALPGRPPKRARCAAALR